MQNILITGNVLPLDRLGLIDQPMFERFQEKLKAGSWCHIFPEGRIWQNWRFNAAEESILGPFKCGVGKLIAHSYPNCPVVLPMYHTGMDKIVPEKVLTEKKKSRPSTPQSIIPKTGQNVSVFVGKPLDFTEKIKTFLMNNPDELESWRTSWKTIPLYYEITEEIRKEVLLLEATAYNRSLSY